MNLVGKIFVVLILVQAVVFGAFAVAVYATHRNWRDVVMNGPDQVTREKPLGLTHQLLNARARTDQLNEQMTKVQQELEVEKGAKRQALTKLETQLTELKTEHTELQKQFAEKDRLLREAVKTVETTQLNTATLRKEVEGLRVDIEKAQKDRDAAFKEVVRLTDELNQAVGEHQRLKATSLKLQQELAEAMNKLRSLPESVRTGAPAPPVDGIVAEVQADGLLQITLGSDHGVRVGRQFDIMRVVGGAASLVGRCEVIRTTPTQSVCKVDPRFAKSPVQRGDRVFSTKQ